MLSPGWSSYEWRLRYRSYDVTALLQPDVGARARARQRLVPRPARLERGRRLLRRPSSPAWRSWRSCSRTATAGRRHRRDLAAGPSAVVPTTSTTARPSTPALLGRLAAAGLTPTERGPACIRRVRLSPLAPYVGPPVRRHEELRPDQDLDLAGGKTLVDFGQNLVGWLRFTVRGPAGTTITVRHAEVLEHDELGTRPLRTRRGDRPFILSGGDDIFEPTFTFHGFRYAEVDGWPGELTADDLDAPWSSTPTCSGPASSSAPTSCSTSCTATSSGARAATSSTCPPTARSATSGSAGPATSPCSRRPRPTSSTSTAFLRDWLVDLAVEQRAADGMVPFVVPDVLKYVEAPVTSSRHRRAPRSGATPRSGCRGRCGRRTATGRCSSASTTRCRRTSAGSSRCCRPPACGTPASSSATGSTRRAAGRPVRGQGRQRRRGHRLPLPHRSHRRRGGRGCSATRDEARHFADLAERTPSAFNEHYVSDDGTRPQRLRDRLRPGDRLRPARRRRQQELAGDRLAELVAESGYRISTGFAGTPFVTDALTHDRAPRRRLPRCCSSGSARPGCTR